MGDSETFEGCVDSAIAAGVSPRRYSEALKKVNAMPKAAHDNMVQRVCPQVPVTVTEIPTESNPADGLYCGSDSFVDRKWWSYGRCPGENAMPPCGNEWQNLCCGGRVANSAENSWK